MSQRHIRQLAWACTAAACTVVVAAQIAVAAPSPQPIPNEYTAPTPQQVTDSIQIWDPSGHVHVWDLEGHITGMESTSTDNGETTVRLDSDILFATDSAELAPAAVDRITELVADVPDSATVKVTGHTDDVGADAYNLDLSQRRAGAVAAAIETGRGDLTLEIDGRGESEPVESNSEAVGREANRRVEIQYSG